MKDLENRGLTEEEINKVISCVKLEGSDSNATLDKLAIILVNTKEGTEGVNELKEILSLVNNKAKLVYDPTIARGLSYYTGPVWEWNITEGGVGSVGGCGRYDNLVGSFLGRDIPATGGSFGIERILEVMKDRGMLSEEANTTKVLVTVFNKELSIKSFEIADLLRSNEISAFVFPEYKPLGKQFEYASKKGIPYAVVIGEDEAKAGKITFKNMETREQEILEPKELLKRLIGLN